MEAGPVAHTESRQAGGKEKGKGIEMDNRTDWLARIEALLGQLPEGLRVGGDPAERRLIEQDNRTWLLIEYGETASTDSWDTGDYDHLSKRYDTALDAVACMSGDVRRLVDDYKRVRGHLALIAPSALDAPALEFMDGRRHAERAEAAERRALMEEVGDLRARLRDLRARLRQVQEAQTWRDAAGAPASTRVELLLSWDHPTGRMYGVASGQFDRSEERRVGK